MSLIKKLAVIGVVAEAARRYAQSNPEKARELADKAAQFADQLTKGKYSENIEQVKRVVANLGGFAQSVATDAGALMSSRPTPFPRV
jgi:hypothetical protein